MQKIRRGAYTTGRVLGDVQAVRKGPRAMAKRLVRKAAGRGFGSIMGRLFR